MLVVRGVCSELSRWRQCKNSRMLKAFFLQLLCFFLNLIVSSVTLTPNTPMPSYFAWYAVWFAACFASLNSQFSAASGYSASSGTSEADEPTSRRFSFSTWNTWKVKADGAKKMTVHIRNAMCSELRGGCEIMRSVWNAELSGCRAVSR